MPDPRAIRAEADRLLAAFRDAGALPVETDILQPAETLLDLYGEEIRARAYVTADPVRGEQMLRPDFTVPVIQAHMASGATPARYCYAGKVFRRQEEPDPGRPAEFWQVGLELIGGTDPAADEAEVFAALAGAVAHRPLQAAFGDIGLLRATVDALSLTEARRAALLRHLWRPRRFRALIDRYAQRKPIPASRKALLARAAKTPVDALIGAAGPLVGRRSAQEIAERVALLQAEAAAPPIRPTDIALLDDLLDLRGLPSAALDRLRDLAVDLPALEPAVDRFEARLDALAARGVDHEALVFEASFGRTHLEYYDGFVFGLFAPDRPDLPPVVTGGRYDALTQALGDGTRLPAVGGVIRPGTLLSLSEHRP